MRPALHPAQTPPVFPTSVEEQSPSRGLGGWAACSSLWPMASGRRAAVFSHRRAMAWAVHPRGCHQQEGWAACTGFSHSSSLEQGGGEGDKSSRQAGQLSPPGSPRPALLPLTCLSLETGEALAAPPGEGAPEWPSRGQPAGWLVGRCLPAAREALLFPVQFRLVLVLAPLRSSHLRAGLGSGVLVWLLQV